MMGMELNLKMKTEVKMVLMLKPRKEAEKGCAAGGPFLLAGSDGIFNGVPQQEADRGGAGGRRSLEDSSRTRVPGAITVSVTGSRPNDPLELEPVSAESTNNYELFLARRLRRAGVRTPRYCEEGKRRRKLQQAGEEEGALGASGGPQPPNSGLDFSMLQCSWSNTSVFLEWNPESPDNWWPREDDDGSAAFLEPYRDFEVRAKVYVNFVYTVRQGQELMAQQSLDAQVQSMFFAQGHTDYGAEWEVLFESYVRLFTQVRADVGIPDLPIVDLGAGASDAMNTARAAAAEAVGNVQTIHFGFSEGTALEGDCFPSGVTLCGRVPRDLQDTFGYDQCDPAFEGLGGARTFQWRASCEDSGSLGPDAARLMGSMMTSHFMASSGPVTGTSRSQPLPLMRECEDDEAASGRSWEAWCWQDLRTT